MQTAAPKERRCMQLSKQVYDTLRARISHELKKHGGSLLPRENRKSRGRPLLLPIIDIITLGVFKHQNGLATKKDLYNLFVFNCSYKTLVVNINRFAIIILALIIRLARENRTCAEKVKFTDATEIPVCLVKNVKYHKTMKEVSAWGMTKKGWFYGLKLHLTIDAKGKILSFSFTAGNVNDRAQFMVLNKYLSGIFVADGGYLSEKMAREFYIEGVRILFAKPRSNMRKVATKEQNDLYSSRAFIESVFRNLKLFDGFVSSLPRSVDGYMANYFYALCARMLA